MERREQPKSLNKLILLFMLICWAVPMIVFFVFTTVTYHKGIIEKAEKLMADELDNIASFAAIRLENIITLCQRPSYEKTWENSWKSYARGELSETEYLQEINTSLKGKFYLDDRFNMSTYYQYGSDKAQCFSSRTGVSYKSYVEDIEPRLLDLIEADSSYTAVRVVDGRIFIVRNLYTTSDYQRYGTLVVELNKYSLFQDVPPDIRGNMVVCFGSSDDFLDFAHIADGEEADKRELLEAVLMKYDGRSDGRLDRVCSRVYNTYLYQERNDDYHIGVVLFAKRAEMYSSLYEFYTILAVMMLLFIPLFVYGAYFLHRHIQIPVDRMMAAYKRMETGEMGIEVDGGLMPNREFQYMKESFDSMSAQVKYLFEYAYDEKLARKDAQIQTLQAQINPHFLNNTLEMMNWQARMSGDMVVSKMIESLGTVLDYRMNRANVREIHLAEELRCIDAYFYIMSMRFGSRLSIEREIDENLLYIMVPPLILQPLVENAIVHGVETVKNGVIRLKVSHDDDHVYLEVRNTGREMTKEDKERIAAILEGDASQIPKKPGRHTSIGIQNVNRRIRLVYGEEYGLTITQEADLETVSRITLPYRERKEDKSLKERNEVESELKNIARLNK